MNVFHLPLNCPNDPHKPISPGKDVPKNLEIFQLFPLSFEDTKTTDRQPCACLCSIAGEGFLEYHQG